MAELGIIDTWGKINPTNSDYTNFSFPHIIYSRIDYFLMFGKDRHKVDSCHTGTTDLSEHSPIYLTIKIGNTQKATQWKFNSSISNKHMVLTEEINYYLQCNDNREVSLCFGTHVR